VARPNGQSESVRSIGERETWWIDGPAYGYAGNGSPSQQVRLSMYRKVP